MALDKTFFEDLEARIPKGKVRTRFAPSPTGYMHVGNLRTALYTWLIARHADGTFILRIEDTDQGRLVEGATDVIYRTMKECHLDHDEGPDVGGPTGPYIQSERRDLYLPYAQLLVEKGAAYYCFCEKAESEEDSGEFDRADDPCRNLSEEEVAAIPALEAISDWTVDAIHDTLIDLAAKLEVKNATLMWPVRIAAAGKLVTPGGAVEICHLLGKDETLRRLRLGLDKLN